jgi:hypothetical protein
MGLLLNGTTQYLTVASVPVTAVPLSMAFWMNGVAVSGQYYYMAISSTTSAQNDLFALTSATNTMSAETSNTAGSTDVVGNSSLTLAASTLYHVCGVWASITSRVCYINGANSGSNATSCAPTAGDFNTCSIGALFEAGAGPLNFTSANIYFPAIWNVALAAGDIASLAAGISPRKIRPANLVRYLRLTGHNSPEPDLMNGTGWTVTAAPAQSANIRMFFP